VASMVPKTNVRVTPRRKRRGVPNNHGPDMAGSLGQKRARYGRLPYRAAHTFR
jgi:hypothetical protein